MIQALCEFFFIFVTRFVSLALFRFVLFVIVTVFFIALTVTYFRPIPRRLSL
jgi:hypothetical protein